MQDRIWGGWWCLQRWKCPVEPFFAFSYRIFLRKILLTWVFNYQKAFCRVRLHWLFGQLKLYVTSVTTGVTGPHLYVQYILTCCISLKQFWNHDWPEKGLITLAGLIGCQGGRQGCDPLLIFSRPRPHLFLAIGADSFYRKGTRFPHFQLLTQQKSIHRFDVGMPANRIENFTCNQTRNKKQRDSR